MIYLDGNQLRVKQKMENWKDKQLLNLPTEITLKEFSKQIRQMGGEFILIKMGMKLKDFGLIITIN